MSVFNKIMYSLKKNQHSDTSVLKDRIYFFIKDSIEFRYDKTDPHKIVSLSGKSSQPDSAVFTIRIIGNFDTTVKQVKPGLYRECVTINGVIPRENLTNRLTLSGHPRLSLVTVKEHTPIKLFGSNIGLTIDNMENNSMTFSTVDVLKEPNEPPIITIDGLNETDSFNALKC